MTLGSRGIASKLECLRTMRARLKEQLRLIDLEMMKDSRDAAVKMMQREFNKASVKRLLPDPILQQYWIEKFGEDVLTVPVNQLLEAMAGIRLSRVPLVRNALSVLL